MNDPLDPSFFDAPPPDRRGPRPRLRFETEAVELPGKSLEAGRPIYEERDYVYITTPGSRDEVKRLAKDKAKEDEFISWAYNKWLATKQEVQDGTPLETVPFLSKSQIMELKAISIGSLETLAEAPEPALQRMMGLRDLKKRAQAYMQQAKDTALVGKLQSELSKRDAEIEMMKEQIKQANARFEALAAKVGSAA